MRWGVFTVNVVSSQVIVALQLSRAALVRWASILALVVGHFLDVRQPCPWHPVRGVPVVGCERKPRWLTASRLEVGEWGAGMGCRALLMPREPHSQGHMQTPWGPTGPAMFWPAERERAQREGAWLCRLLTMRPRAMANKGMLMEQRQGPQYPPLPPSHPHAVHKTRLAACWRGCSVFWELQRTRSLAGKWVSSHTGNEAAKCTWSWAHKTPGTCKTPTGRLRGGGEGHGQYEGRGERHRNKLSSWVVAQSPLL